jgi:hypothetical protein
MFSGHSMRILIGRGSGSLSQWRATFRSRPAVGWLLATGLTEISSFSPSQFILDGSAVDVIGGRR